MFQLTSFLSFSMDSLSIFFTGVILLVTIPSAVYSTGYLRGKYSKGKITAGWILLSLFVVSMAAVVTARNAFLFLFVWELMSLSSYYLVVFDSEQERSVKAGTIYIVMTHIGTAFIAAAFMIMYRYAGSFDFGAMKIGCSAMSPALRNIVFLFLLTGFGTKAGLVPLHVWLPYAHPQAPSHVSSIMSGVMIKTAVYGVIRFIIIILGPGPVWWAGSILTLASLSCLIGIIYALMEHDLKRLLAYSSVENIGIIMLGIGASMFFLNNNLPVAAVLAMTAGLYHLVNHAVFKSLLFLGAGSVYRQAGTKNMEKLGGLIKTMPWTAAVFLVGAMGISALPPFSGFVSEWLTLQSFFLGALGLAGKGKLIMGMCAAVLALTSGLAAACFVKAFGITFLAAPRSQKAKESVEAPGSMITGTVFLALLTILFGVAASPLIRLISKVAAFSAGVDMSGISFGLNNFIISPSGANGALISPPVIAAVLLFAAAAAAFIIYALYGKAVTRKDRTWGCGYYSLDARTEYTATGFSKPFRIAFSFLLRPYRKTTKIEGSDYHARSFQYEVYTTPVIKKYLYGLALKIAVAAAHRMKKLQPGSIHLYIAYIFITIICLLVFMNRF